VGPGALTLTVLTTLTVLIRAELSSPRCDLNDQGGLTGSELTERVRTVNNDRIVQN